jgi:hypothetical protein
MQLYISSAPVPRVRFSLGDNMHAYVVSIEDSLVPNLSNGDSFRDLSLDREINLVGAHLNK